MTASQIFLVVDAGTPVAAFTARHELKAFLQRRRDGFTDPLVYMFRSNHDPSIMIMSPALAEWFRRCCRTRRSNGVEPMTIFFTADTHLGHKNIITSTNRPFKSVAEMDSAIVKRWNERVTRHDLVYHLGDFAFDDHDPYLELLNGQKHLILGNHDHWDRVKKAARWQGIRELKEIKVGETKIVLCHYALRTWNGSHRGALQLYGHSHCGLAGDSQSLDVGVDCWDFRPVTLDEIKERLATMPKRVELDHHRPSE